METIILNLNDPSWWFTGLFFVFLVWALKLISKFLLKQLKRILKGQRLKRLNKIRTYRMSLASITYEVVRSHAYFVSFLLICMLYLLWYTTTPLTSLFKANPIVFLIISLPIYIAEIVWLIRDSFSRDLVKAHNKALKYARKKRGQVALTRAF